MSRGEGRGTNAVEETPTGADDGSTEFIRGGPSSILNQNRTIRCLLEITAKFEKTKKKNKIRFVGLAGRARDSVVKKMAGHHCCEGTSAVFWPSGLA